MSTIEINYKRLEHLMELYDVNKHDILEKINAKRKREFSESNVFCSNILLNALKALDKAFFKKGLSFYTNPQDIPRSGDTSLFFRKESFNSPLEFRDRMKISEIESSSQGLSAVVKLSGYKLPKRQLKTYDVRTNPQIVAQKIRDQVDFTKLNNCRDDRKYLNLMIQTFANLGIIVYEFIDRNHTKPDKAISWEGVFLKPNTIAIKRQQNAFKREIFTLAHELGHYLLDSEEIDQSPFKKAREESLKDIENWCNAFAFAFILNEKTTTEEMYKKFDDQPDIHNAEIKKLSKDIHISRLAIYAHFLNEQKITWRAYESLRLSLKDEHNEKMLRDAEKREEDTRQGKIQFFSQPKPIHSNLEKRVYHYAFFEGTIEEMDIIKRFKPNIKQVKKGYIDTFLYGDDF